jgi:hypothetical protein
MEHWIAMILVVSFIMSVVNSIRDARRKNES